VRQEEGRRFEGDEQVAEDGAKDAKGVRHVQANWCVEGDRARVRGPKGTKKP